MTTTQTILAIWQEIAEERGQDPASWAALADMLTDADRPVEAETARDLTTLAHARRGNIEEPLIAQNLAWYAMDQRRLLDGVQWRLTQSGKRE